MRYLLDTHVLLWAAVTGSKKSPTSAHAAAARKIIANEQNALYFSPASIWEVAIKNALGRPEFKVDPHVFRRGLLDHGYEELPITSAHTVEVGSLPPHHADPFDRLLIAQATVEGMLLLTHDEKIAAYQEHYPIRMI